MSKDIDESEIYAAINKVMDPELNHGLVDLGLVREVEIAGDTVHVELQLTTPHCPFAAEIVQRVHGAVSAVQGVRSVDVTRHCTGDA